jgi:hypothetical protein
MSIGSLVTARGETRLRLPAADLTLLVGVAALGFSALYLLSDLIELAEGGFSTPQLALTYIAEAAIPLFIIGLLRESVIALLGWHCVRGDLARAPSRKRATCLR